MVYVPFNIEENKDFSSSLLPNAPDEIESYKYFSNTRNYWNNLSERTKKTKRVLKDMLKVSIEPESHTISFIAEGTNQKEIEYIAKNAERALNEIVSNTKKNINQEKYISVIQEYRKASKTLSQQEDTILKLTDKIPILLASNESTNTLAKVQEQRENDKKSYEILSKQRELLKKRASLMAENFDKLFLSDPDLQESQQRIRKQMQEVELLQSDEGPESPILLKAQNNLETLQRNYKIQVKAKAESLESLTDPQYFQIVTEQKTLEMKMQASKMLEDSLKNSIKKYSTLNAEYKSQKVKITELASKIATYQAKIASDVVVWTIVDPAGVETDYVSPRPVRDLAATMLLGFALMIIFGAKKLDVKDEMTNEK